MSTSDQETARAASSPLSLRIEIMNCEFATPVMRADDPVPAYNFEPQNACPFMKTQPDQDCRTCRHHRIKVLGTDDPFWRHRYHGYGVVLPVRDKAALEAVMAALEAHDGLPLRRPDWEPGGVE